jgi:hypothetical protein
MGLMGRKSFTNDKRFPFAIAWDRRDTGQILYNIELEAVRIGNVNYEVSEAVKKYISIGNDWLHTGFWSRG